MIRDIEIFLTARLGRKDVEDAAEWASICEENRDRLFNIAFSGAEKHNSNALWCLTHLRKNEADWLESKQDYLIDSLLFEKDEARKRMILQLLREQNFHSDNMRVDFLDFCLSKINSACEPYAIRCFSLYISIKMCRHFPELLSELQERIDMLSREPLSPGMRCAVRKVKEEIRSLPKS